MNSTKSLVETDTIEVFFTEELLPVAQALEEAGKSLFPAGPDPASASYYVERAPTPAPAQVFEIDPARLPGALAELWKTEGFPELAGLAESSGRMAEALRESIEPDASVSPFLYVMF